MNGRDNGQVPPKRGFMEKMHPMSWGVGMGLEGLKAFRPIRSRPATSPRGHEKMNANQGTHTVQLAQLETYLAPRDEEISLLLMQNHFLHSLHHLQNQNQLWSEGVPQNQAHIAGQPLAPGTDNRQCPKIRGTTSWSILRAYRPSQPRSPGLTSNSLVLSWEEICAYVDPSMRLNILLVPHITPFTLVPQLTFVFGSINLCNMHVFYSCPTRGVRPHSIVFFLIQLSVIQIFELKGQSYCRLHRSTPFSMTISSYISSPLCFLHWPPLNI